jgi:hypothetical protein
VKRFLLLACLLGLAGCRLDDTRYERLVFAPGAPCVRVLMIGNSLTYYNDLPGLLQQLSAREPAPVYVEKITTPLASLQVHWNFDASVQRIGEGDWDCVVLQEFSRLPVTNPQQSLEYFERFADEVRRSGGTPIIFQNWTRRDRDDEYDALHDAYRQIVARTHATLAPIGAAWCKCRSAHPDIELLLDERHPTDEGTYLAACVLYDVLYHKKSSDLPLDLAGPKLADEVTVLLRRVADETVTNSGE